MCSATYFDIFKLSLIQKCETLLVFLPRSILYKWRVYFQNLLNPLLVLLRKTGFLWQNLYTCLWEETNFEKKKKRYLRELSRSKFRSVTTCSSNVILYNDVKNSIFIKSGFNRFWKWALQMYKFLFIVRKEIPYEISHFLFSPESNVQYTFNLSLWTVLNMACFFPEYCGI